MKHLYVVPKSMPMQHPLILLFPDASVVPVPGPVLPPRKRSNRLRLLLLLLLPLPSSLCATDGAALSQPPALKNDDEVARSAATKSATRRSPRTMVCESTVHSPCRVFFLRCFVVRRQ